MLIEHTFVTTLESERALSAARELLSQAGFIAESPCMDAPPTDAPGNSLQLRRGRAGARNATENLQRIHLEWDRGRINLAAFIEPRPQNRSFSRGAGGIVIFETRSSRQKKKLYSDLMIAVSRSVELLLANGMPLDDASRDWLALESKIKETARKTRRRNLLCWSCLIAFIITMLIFLSSNTHR